MSKMGTPAGRSAGNRMGVGATRRYTVRERMAVDAATDQVPILEDASRPSNPSVIRLTAAVMILVLSFAAHALIVAYPDWLTLILAAYGATMATTGILLSIFTQDKRSD